MCENCNSKTWNGEYFGSYIIKPKIEGYNLPTINEEIYLNPLYSSQKISLYEPYDNFIDWALNRHT